MKSGKNIYQGTSPLKLYNRDNENGFLGEDYVLFPVELCALE